MFSRDLSSNQEVALSLKKNSISWANTINSGVACCRGQSKASAGIHLEEYDAEHKLQTYNDDRHKESSLYDGESPWEQECNCNNEHGRCGRVEGDADFETHYMFALNK